MNVMANANMEELTAKVAELEKENTTLKADLKKRSDEVGAVSSKLEKLQKDHEALKAQAGIKDAEEPGKAKIKVMDEKKKEPVEKQVTIATPFVRVNEHIVSSVAFMKIAAGKAITKEEQEKYPVLDTISQDDVLQTLTKWASMKVGFLKFS